ncbi:uncharacterized protein SETTUDRAFT_143043 [Exserohilum turcica Et28A]|uniref:EGF-like domain-containing protein n=1 Tax=Exserohilum turcicum (strain 28A) TaxID=671987 RepID=R0JZ29_EXST2|nr:uncharacterized protein SETTUDRAFT_143043 [Exserohilum turcica Et28A]EOA81492.1 hypothetical protein SETTUDRAFT_143043 [Exserohilum turcica Et28A]
MSYDPRLGAGAYGATDADGDGYAKKGSVRAARERMQAAQKRTQLPDTSKIIGLPRRPNQLRQQQQQEQQQQQQAFQRAGPSRLQINTDSRSDTDSSSPSPQWPLPNVRTQRVDPVPDIPPRSPRRGQPPQLFQDSRPLSEEYPIQQLSPELASPVSPGYLHPNDTLSPSSYRSSRPITTSSIASDSSMGSIPDFPVPQPPMPSIQQARRFPSIGPPPSARRGPSSYYTQMSYVSPIVEESESHSTAIQSQRGSFASSNVFPSNQDAFYPDDDPFSDEEDMSSTNTGFNSPTDHDDQRGLVRQSPTLVRQASLGRRTKPSLMTIKTVDSSTKSRTDGAVMAAGAMGLGAAAMAARDSYSSRSRSPLSRESSSDSLSTLQTLRNKMAAGSTSSPLSQELRPITLADRAGARRPPRLDMEAVREAEARGSLTSLPDLIRRATRLASNLDRGRTASRLGMDFWETGAPEKNDVRQSGLSEMLAAFPPPGQETPERTGRGTPNNTNGGNTEWPSVRNSNNNINNNNNNNYVDVGVQNEKPQQRRKCCGMRLWVFILLLIILLLIIAAAVVIPVVLVVIPNQNKAASNSAAQDNRGNNNSGNDVPSTNPPPMPSQTAGSGNGQCSGVITCQNGGVAILNADRSCNCICINGFTGRTCTNNDATGCTTVTIAGTAKNATTGSAIPRLIEDANTMYNVTLDPVRILSLFSTLSLSCAAENALITFNGLASRSVSKPSYAMDLRAALHPSRTRSTIHHLHPAKIPGHQVKRQTVGQSGQGEASNNRNSAGTKAQIPQPISSDINSLDLGRIAVLLTLQVTGSLDTAATAQESIQTLLTNNRNGLPGSSIVDTGPFKVDLVKFTIQFNNGTTIQSKPSSKTLKF